MSSVDASSSSDPLVRSRADSSAGGNLSSSSNEVIELKPTNRGNNDTLKAPSAGTSTITNRPRSGSTGAAVGPDGRRYSVLMNTERQDEARRRRRNKKIGIVTEPSVESVNVNNGRSLSSQLKRYGQSEDATCQVDPNEILGELPSEVYIKQVEGADIRDLMTTGMPSSTYVRFLCFLAVFSSPFSTELERARDARDQARFRKADDPRGADADEARIPQQDPGQHWQEGQEEARGRDQEAELVAAVPLLDAGQVRPV